MGANISTARDFLSCKQIKSKENFFIMHLKKEYLWDRVLMSILNLIVM